MRKGMFRAGLVLLLGWMSVSAWAFSQTDARNGWPQVQVDPEGLLAQWQNKSAKTPALETERLLLVGFAHYELVHKPEVEQILLRLAERQHTPIQQARQMLLEGLYSASMRSKFDYALQQFDAANVALTGQNDQESLRLQVQILTLSGSLLRYLRRLPEAIERLGQARQRAISLGDKGTLAETERELGRALRFADQPRLAAEHYMAALNLAKHVTTPTFPGKLELELARLYRTIGEYGRAMEHAHNSAALLESLNNTQFLSEALFELGTIHREMGDPGQALQHLMLALDLELKNESVLAIARLRITIALTYLDIGEPDKSLEYLQLALAAATEREHKELMFNSRQALSQTYLALGRWTDALLLAEELLVQSRQEEDKTNERALLMVMAEANRALSRTEQAWAQLRQAADIPISVPGSGGGLTAANQLAEQQLRNQLQQQGEALNHSKALLNNLQNQRLLIVLLLIALSLSLLLLWSRHRHKGTQLSELHHQVHTYQDTGAGNRRALFQALKRSESGYLILLKLGDFAASELRTGQAQFTRQRQQLIEHLRSEEWVDDVFEPSLGLAAIIIRSEVPMESEILRLFDRLQSGFNGELTFQGPISAGIIPLPFQPGSLLRLPPEQALELTQLALWSADDLANRTGSHQFVQLRPVALSAPLLNPEQLYASAVKGIQHGVIRCLVSNGHEDLRWPGTATQAEQFKHEVNNEAKIAQH
ncbi:tetratricopeptide repeat protein [Ferrimonas balearica]|uniref:tetratricopeptide repeat protein n=1 Tax=Ferrimonas balearica TaxID=44012 RepID=UPI001C98E588|nr:tetratricopeptide repeat protein [Ferrimonas balearica]MBY5921940.1 tetratricopeptide repeat protein [Ferrimonas balearica]MBY5994720.1 tetratricopeptide repeat protein [Ferrimonas balearica]